MRMGKSKTIDSVWSCSTVVRPSLLCGSLRSLPSLHHQYSLFTFGEKKSLHVQSTATETSRRLSGTSRSRQLCADRHLRVNPAPGAAARCTCSWGAGRLVGYVRSSATVQGTSHFWDCDEISEKVTSVIWACTGMCLLRNAALWCGCRWA